MNLLLAGAVAMLLGACGQAPDEVPQAVVSSDPALASEAADLLEGLAERSGLPLTSPVRVEYRSRDELEAFLLERLAEELPPEEAAWLRDSYALLGLVSPDLDLYELLLTVYREQVAGFYDPTESTLFVMNDQPREATRTVLVHELVHAVQDQSTDLDSIPARERGNDRLLAAQAAIEGHATLVMFESLMSAQGMAMDLGQLPDFAGTIRPALEAMQGQFPALANAPPIFRETLLFPYLEGAGFVQTMWRQAGPEGRRAPFGDLLPQSTEQVLDPARFLEEPRDAPTTVILELPPGPRLLYSDGLGALETGILLSTLAGPAAESARSGWDGDQYVLMDVEGGRALAWYSVWDEPGSRDRFVRLLSDGLDRLPAPAELVPMDSSGRPGVLLLVAGAPAPSVSLEGGLP